MKAKIGKYITWWGPYQIADLLQKVGVSEDTCYKIGERLAETPLMNLCEWIHSKRKRTVKIKLDYWDHWNAFHTIAIVTLPVLQALREHTISAGFIEDADVPEELRSDRAPETEFEGEADDNWFPRYNWALDEMIYAFEKMVDDDFDEIMIDDKEEREATMKRINHGLYLYGKYFRTLWD